MENIAVIYHKDCPDGFSGAWVAWKKFGDKAEYFPIEKRGESPGIENKEVYIIDFSFTKPVLSEIKEKNNKVTVIDHHKSAAEFTKEIADKYIYSEEEAACRLAWKYFFPEKSLPKLLEYVEDIDLWRFQIPYSKEIGEIIELIGFDNFEKWSCLAEEIENGEKRKERIKTGKVLLEYKSKIIEKIAESAYEVKFENMKVLAVNSPVFRSQLGNLLASKRPPLGIVWQKRKESIKVSLRGNGSIDVSKIAKKYGGGGHPNAASFTIPKNKKMPWENDF